MLPLWPRASVAVGAVDEEGLGVLDAAGAGGGVAGVADGGEAPQMQKVFLLEDLRDETHVLADDRSRDRRLWRCLRSLALYAAEHRDRKK